MMARWSRGERTVRSVVYEVPADEPWGANWNEVQQALSLAWNEYKSVFGREPSDDAIRVHASDDRIRIEFDVHSSLTGGDSSWSQEQGLQAPPPTS
jgi:hypothetical protein